MTTAARIAIAGAGVAGLTTALALLQQGFKVDVFEQASQLGELGAGLQISPNGSRVLQALGLEAALKTCVSQAQGKEIRMWNTGQRWKLFDLGEDCLARFGAPYWMVHRGDLHRVLVEAFNARSDRPVRLNARVVNARSTEAGVTFELNDGSQHRADGLLAADGVHSVLREQLLGEDKAQFTGLLAWRGLVPVERLSAHLQAPVGTNWVGPGAHVITYPVRGGQLMNVVGIIEREGWRSESWTERGTHAELLQDFGHWHADVCELMSAIEQPFKWALLGRAPQTGWAQGRVCLLGDAAHPTLPFLAQGANMAIEDAAVMARCLALDASPAQAFVRFEKLRWQRTADIVNRSRDNAQRFHNPQLSDPDKAVDYVSSEWEPEKVRRRYDWMFEYDPLKVPL
ncbi:FAD-dependent monooxygenase [Limnohabitans sp. Rim28]|uniref:FAD-dependent monooxygenase n=1 Tax=Limnohabitans sp. Rim28 TaxID=1100720 RepID=UPI000303DA8D|nr:FAD-dependent monooxygenase [Limnohabitans sp. Rim28]PVE09682.1 monooxygenase [Limnohabitans sp. Rim28]